MNDERLIDFARRVLGVKDAVRQPGTDLWDLKRDTPGGGARGLTTADLRDAIAGAAERQVGDAEAAVAAARTRLARCEADLVAARARQFEVRRAGVISKIEEDTAREAERLAHRALDEEA